MTVPIKVEVGVGDGVCCLRLDDAHVKTTQANANNANKTSIKINNFRLSIYDCPPKGT